MAKVSKRVAANKAKIERTKFYLIDEALGLVKSCASAKFDESIDVAVQLGIDAKKSDQVVRGSVVLLGRYRQVGARGRVRPGRKGRSRQALLVLISSAWKTWPSK